MLRSPPWVTGRVQPKRQIFRISLTLNVKTCSYLGEAFLHSSQNLRSQRRQSDKCDCMNAFKVYMQKKLQI